MDIARRWLLPVVSLLIMTAACAEPRSSALATPDGGDGGSPTIDAGVDAIEAGGAGVDVAGDSAGAAEVPAKRCGDGVKDDNEDCDNHDPTNPDGPCLATCKFNEVVDVSVGSHNVCALKTSGVGYCWGINDFGNLGDGTKNTTYTPKRVLSKSQQVSAGFLHSCDTTTEGRVRCWGDNASGQLGQSVALAEILLPQDVLVRAGVPLEGMRQVASGSSNSCALGSDGGVTCWGSDEAGMNGNGVVKAASIVAPAPVANLTGVLQISSLSSGHVCAVVDGGALRCWGDNSSGQANGAGLTMLPPLSRPTAVNGLSDGDVTMVAAGNGASCAVLKSGAVTCWGQIAFLPYGTVSSEPPTIVPGLMADGVTMGYTRCAWKKTGGVWCWGRGPNAAAPTTVPTPVAGLDSKPIVKVAMGDQGSCAIAKDNGRNVLYCWSLFNMTSATPAQIIF